MRKTQIFMNKLVYLSPSILKSSKIVTYEFRYDYVKPKHEENTRLCYIDTYSFIVNIKTDFYLKGGKRLLI